MISLDVYVWTDTKERSECKLLNKDKPWIEKVDVQNKDGELVGYLYIDWCEYRIEGDFSNFDEISNFVERLQVNDM